MVTIMDGKKLSDRKIKVLEERVNKLPYIPKLAVVSVGDNAASEIYIRNKTTVCKKIGIDFEEIHIEPQSLEEYDVKRTLYDVIRKLNQDDEVDGILIQSPIANVSDEEDIFDKVIGWKDVDAFNSDNVYKLYNGNNEIISCTPRGILSLLDEYEIDVTGKHCVIVGRSTIVGKPLALALLNRNATVTICHSKTEYLARYTQQADILITAIGVPKKFNSTWLGDKTDVVIDVGINRDENGKLCGDCDYNQIIDQWWFEVDVLELEDRPKFITPVPKGVGPLIVVSMIENLLDLAEKRRSIE